MKPIDGITRFTRWEMAEESNRIARTLSPDSAGRQGSRRNGADYEKQVAAFRSIEHRLTPRATVAAGEKSNERKAAMLRGELPFVGEVERFTTNAPVKVYRR